MKQVIFLNSHPIQYFVPLYEEITSATNICLEVVYCNDATIKGQQLDKGFGTTVQWDIPLLSGYKSVFLKNNSPQSFQKNNGFFSLINFGILNYLHQKPSSIIIVHGWKYFTFVLTIVAARLLGHTVVLRGENPWNQERQKNKIITAVKHLYLRCLFLFVHKVLYIGKQNKMFYEHLGIKQGDLLYAPYSVDNKRFRDYFKNTTKQQAKEKLGIPAEVKVVLYSGKYIAKKRPSDLLKAFAALQISNVILVMVGEGELRAEMENFIAQHELKERVVLTGFINQSQIPVYYRASDVFVMCSGLGETWGLSINEALNFGIPVIVSDTCGSAYDLVDEGVNGSMFKTGNIQQLTAALYKYLNTDEEDKKQIAARSLQIVDGYSYQQIIKSVETLAASN